MIKDDEVRSLAEKEMKLSDPRPLEALPAALSPDALGAVIAEMMSPVMQTIVKMLEHNTEAMDRLSATQTIQNDRMEALERQIRLQTPVTSKQVSYLNDAIRARARELLDKRGIEDGKATTKLGNAIRKAVLARYGIASLREIPKHEYGVAMSLIGMWSDSLTVRDVVKEARERAEVSDDAMQTPGLDGGKASAGQMD